ncbi:unnamed protein product, partial [Musa textilis]
LLTAVGPWRWCSSEKRPLARRPWKRAKDGSSADGARPWDPLDGVALGRASVPFLSLARVTGLCSGGGLVGRLTMSSANYDC